MIQTVKRLLEFCWSLISHSYQPIRFEDQKELLNIPFFIPIESSLILMHGWATGVSRLLSRHTLRLYVFGVMRANKCPVIWAICYGWTPKLPQGWSRDRWKVLESISYSTPVEGARTRPLCSHRYWCVLFAHDSCLLPAIRKKKCQRAQHTWKKKKTERREGRVTQDEGGSEKGEDGWTRSFPFSPGYVSAPSHGETAKAEKERFIR